MTFEPIEITASLGKNSSIFRELFDNLSEAAVRFKPAPEKWNILEVACHLLDEEREDFRARLKHVLDQNPDPLPSINPPMWVTEHHYAAQHLPDIVEKFVTERSQSVEWLNSMENVNWELFYEHPKLGKMTAKLFLSNWLAHDYLHIRQILGLKFGFLQSQTGEDLSYAGTW